MRVEVARHHDNITVGLGIQRVELCTQHWRNGRMKKKADSRCHAPRAQEVKGVAYQMPEAPVQISQANRALPEHPAR